MENDIQTWLKNARMAGFSDTQIQGQLKQAGWNDIQINQLLGSSMATPTATAVAEPVVPMLSLPGVFSLMKEAWETFKTQIVKLLVVIVIFGVASGIIYFAYMLVAGLLIGGSVLSILSLDNMNSVTGWIVGFLIGFLLVTIFYFLVSLITAWMQTAVLVTIRHGKAPSSFDNIFRESFRLMIPLWWVTILMGFFTTGASFLFGIPGIIVAVWLSMAIFIVVTENIRGMQAILRSREYVRGAWWAVFGRVIALVAMFAGAIFVVFITLTILGALLRDDIITSLISIISFIISFAVVPFLTVYIIIYNFTLFKNLRIYKAHSDLTPQKKTKTALLVMAIVGWIIIPLMLAGIGFVALNGARGKALDATRKSDIMQIRTALILYQDDHQFFPSSLNLLATEYISRVPTDPKYFTPYRYTVIQTGSYFTLCADLVSGGGEYCVDSTGRTGDIFDLNSE